MIKKGVYCSREAIIVLNPKEQFYDCVIKGKFRIKEIKSTNPIAVGDKVLFKMESDRWNSIGVIIEIEARQNYIIRKSVNLSKQIHIIASNIDQVF